MSGPAVYNVENACASGATAVHLARHALLAGEYDTVLIFGVEQLTQLGGGTIPLQRNDFKTELHARWHGIARGVRDARDPLSRGSGAKAENLAGIAVKNRYHGSLNEYAQQRTPTTVDEVLASRMVAEPLTKIQARRVA